jgi:hypothetical protein
VDDILEMMQILLLGKANLLDENRSTIQQRTSSRAQERPWFQMHVVLLVWESSFIMTQNDALLISTETDHVKALPH